LAFFKIPFRGVGRQTAGWFPNIADVGWVFFFKIILTGRSYTSSNVNPNYNTKANRWWPTYIIETKQKNHQTFDAVCYARDYVSNWTRPPPPIRQRTTLQGI
jgi:hypothetical protein